MPKPKILVLIDWYLPGYKAGGPIQSIHNLVKILKPNYDFAIITMNKDHTSSIPYEDVESDRWTKAPDGNRIWYFSDKGLSYNKLKKLIHLESPDFVYLNSMYSIPFTLWPWWMFFRKGMSGKLVLAPRGMLQAGAIKIRWLKKRIYIALIKLLGSHKKLIWHATDQQEKEDVGKYFGQKLDIRVAPNIPKQDQRPWKQTPKKSGSVHFVFTSRVSEKKNIEFFLQRLLKCNGNVVFDIFGPVETESYLEKCKLLIAQLPDSMQVRFHDAVPNDQLPLILESRHFSVLTTHAENFGHAIFEGLLAGRPVIISDRTPWRNLARDKAGWDIPLEQTTKFETVIQACIDMDQVNFNAWSESAWKYAKQFKEAPELRHKMEKVFS